MNQGRALQPLEGPKPLTGLLLRSLYSLLEEENPGIQPHCGNPSLTATQSSPDPVYKHIKVT